MRGILAVSLALGACLSACHPTVKHGSVHTELIQNSGKLAKMSGVPQLGQTWKTDINCNAGFNDFCTTHWSDDISANHPGYDICNVKLDIREFDPPNPGTDPNATEYAITQAVLKGMPDGTRVENKAFADVQTAGSRNIFAPRGASYNFSVVYELIKSDVDNIEPNAQPNELRKDLGCVPLEYTAPVPRKPVDKSRTTACACVQGDERQVQACLEGKGDCNRLTQMTYSTCVSNKSECVTAFAGGKCPSDLDSRYKQVIVENSRYCAR